MSAAPTVTIAPASTIRGHVTPPGDKSISHRYALLAALADGTSTIRGYSTGADCESTLACLRQLGVSVTTEDTAGGLTVAIAGRGLAGLAAPAPDTVLDAGNSGSTMRMLAGVVAAHPFVTPLTGDASLRRRPMRRVIAPLERMGARIDSDDGRPPLTIHGVAEVQAIDFEPPVPSAQVKSAILLAGLHARGRTRVREVTQTRDHTERALASFGVRLEREATSVSLVGGQRLVAQSLEVPGDVSAAAFWMAAAAGLPGSEIVICHIGLNPTRTGIIDILRRMGAVVHVEPSEASGSEPFGRVTVRHGGLQPAEVTPDEVPGVIDELPVLAALATHGGSLRVTGAQELRVKESDRISALADGLRKMGGQIEEFPDGFHVEGRERLRGGVVDACEDHRLAMAFAIAALGASGPTTIHGAEAAAVSYPHFFSVLDSLRA